MQLMSFSSKKVYKLRGLDLVSIHLLTKSSKKSKNIENLLLPYEKLFYLNNISMLQSSSAHPFTSGILLCIKDHCILTAQAHQSPGPRDKSDSY